MAQRRLSQPEAVVPPLRPRLADQPSRFVLLEREVELEYRPQMLETLQRKVNTVAEEARATAPGCPRCGQPMSYHDARSVTWLAHWGRLKASPVRYRCTCKQECRPLLNLRAWNQAVFVVRWPAGWDAGRCGSLRTGVTAGTVVLGSRSAPWAWRVAQRLGQAAASHTEALSQYHADSRSEALGRAGAAGGDSGVDG
jgi:hypothetical protein